MTNLLSSPEFPQVPMSSPLHPLIPASFLTMSLSTLQPQLESLAATLPGTAGVVVKDLTPAGRGQSITLNENEPFPAASIIKLSILWAFFEQVEAGRITTDERISLDAADQVGGSGVLYTLAAGLNLTLLDLATLMITVSDNTATNILIDRLGLAAITQTITNLGLTGTKLQRKMFDYERARLGFENLTTPADTAALLGLMHQSNRLTPDSHQKMLYMLEQQQFNERLSRELPNKDTVRFAHKTGTLPDRAEHDAGILYIGDRPLILVALTKNLTHSADAAHFCAQLGRLVYNCAVSV
jgi:beta-lactamase class A